MTTLQVAAKPAYLDTCVVFSLFLADHGYGAAEQWLISQGKAPILVSHWLLVEFAGVVALCQRRGDLSPKRAAAIHSEFHCFRCERLQLVEPRASDFLQAQAWLQTSSGPPLRGADALHLAIAQRENLTLTTADRALIQAAHNLGVAHHWISTQPS